METGNLRNEDFRKLLASKRSDGSSAAPATERREAPSHSFTHKQQLKQNKKQKYTAPKPKKEKREEDEDEAQLREILKNYRDRAAERREKGDEPTEDARLAAAYRAVPGDSRAARDAFRTRKEAIENSKYLGGDMEHTHLVKGLDYSLLNKVRSEISKTEKTEVDDDDFEEALHAPKSKDAVAVEEASKPSENKMVRNLQRLLLNTELPVRNDHFMRGRMAYVVDLDEEEADIPTTLLRSLHDCPRAESNASVAVNEKIIQQLTDVLSYLRTDKTKKKKQAEVEGTAKAAGDDIYDNETEYVPAKKREERRDDRDRERDRHRKDDRRRDDRDRDRERDGRRDYFNDGSRRERDREDGDRKDRHRDDDRRGDRDDRRDRDRERDKEREQRDKERKEKEAKEKEKRLEEKMKKRQETEGYDECYPGGMEELGCGWDSDEEDLQKMDGVKGDRKKWDFDNEGDYSEYQGKREAMPKAAFQFGVKAGDGRKTRKNDAAKAERAVDRELGQINQILEKRKAAQAKGEDVKKMRY